MKTIIAFCGATVILTAVWGMTAAAPPAAPAEAAAHEGAPDRSPITDNRPWFPAAGRFGPEPGTRVDARLHGTWDTRTGRRIRPVPTAGPAGVRLDLDARAD